MKELKVFYAKIDNMGDLLNELIIEKVFGYKVKCSNRYTCETTGIGSGLNMFFPEKAEMAYFPKNLLQRTYAKLNSPLQVWSTGFIKYPKKEDNICMRRENNIASVRGELTKKRLEKILNKNLKIPTGDGGLLASCLLEGKIEKKYNIGIIPHFRERNELRFKQLQLKYENSTLIDLTEDPMDVVKKISECEHILSSSLHGLIVADSFNIPNKRIVYSDKPLGDGYKYDDYYSAFNISVEPYNINNDKYPSINNIIDDYKVNKKDVDLKKEDLITSFTKFL
ncbi:polysaccharide pyruvyl transferase family protein [Sporolactobacillus shoreicorticis]|uniref:Polysaccharide pyruvyl transferase family protein n=1 Tax=Sporolactobacillus shoreicorticis TaxID=1923877 RepID=A0ABW5S3V2_9BACL|nr:polysaccharide pyruvyl transferase family protein [Sporolactobacillus shoreicorticis]MCO7124183.1 polysaccharide pyruvyl transferase family protein [Sporolactobacillus shoreicorticis]